MNNPVVCACVVFYTSKLNIKFNAISPVRRSYLWDSLVDVENDEGCWDEAHGEDDADGVQQRDADLPDHLSVQLLLREVHRVVRHRHPVPLIN